LPGHRTSHDLAQYAPVLMAQEYADDDSPMGNATSPSSFVVVGCERAPCVVSLPAPAQPAMTPAIRSTTRHGAMQVGCFAG